MGVFSGNIGFNQSSGVLLSCCVMNSTGTWSCPAGTRTVEVWTIGGGGGGGAGTVSSAFCSFGSGGGGGGGGGLSYCRIGTALASTVCVCVGAGGGLGGGGGASCFGTLVCSGGGNPGAAGVPNQQSPGGNAYSPGGAAGSGNINNVCATWGRGGAGCATGFTSAAQVTGSNGELGCVSGGGAGGWGKSAAYSGTTRSGGSGSSYEGQSGGGGGNGGATPQNGSGPGGGGAGGNSNFCPGIATPAGCGSPGRVIIKSYC